MATGSYVQLNENDILEDVTLSDSSEPNLYNFGGKKRQKPRRTMSGYRDLNSMHIHVSAKAYGKTWKSKVFNQ